MQSVLITGGAGFIGSHLAEFLLPRTRVRVLDDFRSGHRRNLAGLAVDVREGSVLDEHALAAAMEGVDTVFHLAAQVSVPESVERPHESLELNLTGTLRTLEAATRAGVRKLVFASSAAVYGDDPTVPKVETMLPAPRSPYALGKLAGEYLCSQWTALGRIETACLRFFNVFGPRQDPAGPYGAAVPVFFRQALAHAPIVIHGDGGQTRDFIYVRDIARALAFVAEQPGLTGVFNAGYGGQTTILELARRICALTGSRSEIRHAPPRLGDVRHSRAAVDRLRAAGFEPGNGLEAGLAATYAAWRG